MLHRYGSSKKELWALITGSAMGIGKAYSQELAKIGFNIIMIDKEDDKMDKTQKELELLGIKVGVQAFSCYLFNVNLICNQQSYLIDFRLKHFLGTLEIF